MQALHYIFIILEDEFDKSSIISTENCSVKVQCAAIRPVGYASNAENSSDIVVVGQL